MSRNFDLLQRAEKELEADHTREVERQREQLQKHVVMAQQTPASPESASAAEQHRATLEMEAPARDEVAKLVQRVFLLPGACKVVSFTGVEEGSGCTWLISRAAEVLASQIAGTVCLVDGNFRSPGLHDCFGVKNGYGLTDAVMEGGPIRQFARPLGQSNLWLMSGGSMASNGHTFMGSEPLRARMAELRSAFDYVLIDAPALTQGGDAIIWGHLADGTVLVMGANSTHRETARRAAIDLATANVRLLGAVLNRRTFPIPDKLYARL